MILYSVDGGVAHITLNRPDKRNALNDQVIQELKDALSASSKDAAVRVVAVTGAGKDFCSGADLSALHDMAEASVLDHVASARHLAEAFLAMRHHPRPVVAVVRGRALAGGCGLATACDIVLAAESAQFGYPEVGIGFIPAMVMAILRRSVSERRAFELITTGEIISATTARDIGMIHRVWPDAQFDQAAEDYIAKLSAKSPSALSLSKNLLYYMDGMTFEEALEAGIQANAIARMTEDCKRGVERFLKKP